MSYEALPVLRTPRLTLRPLTDHDTDALVAGVGNYDVSRWLAVVPYPYKADDAQAFIAKVRAQANPFWGIHDTGGLIGVVSLDDELAYWIARPAWGNGYGFEAAREACRYWFSDSGAGDLASGFFDGNDRSGRVLSALGFHLKERITRFARSFQQEVTSNQMVLTRKAWEARQDFTLYTPRLTIRPFADSDATALMQIAVPEVTRMLFSLHPNLTEDMAHDFMSARAWRGLPGFALAIERQGKMIGYVACSATLELYYALHPDHWRGGIMTEALSAFLPELFERFPIDRLKADRFDDNPASGALLEKFGFAETGDGMGSSHGRLEPAPIITYALERDRLKVPV